MPLTLPSGTEIVVDALWRAARLVAEVDGRAFHATRAAFARDRRRDAELTLLGLRPIRLTAADLAADRARTAALLRALLTRPADGRAAAGGGRPAGRGARGAAPGGAARAPPCRTIAGMDLTCPKCENPMRRYERSGVTVDQCTGCRGVFLDRGELERLVDQESSYYEGRRPEPRREERYEGRRDEDDDDRYKRRDHDDDDDRYKRREHHGHGYGHGKRRKREGFLGELFDF